MKLTVLGGRELVSGFRLAGIEGIEVLPDAHGRELFLELAQKRNIAIIVLSQSLYRYLKSDIDEVRSKGSIPAVIGLPERTDEMTPPTAASFMEAVGLGVATKEGR